MHETLYYIASYVYKSIFKSPLDHFTSLEPSNIIDIITYEVAMSMCDSYLSDAATYHDQRQTLYQF